ncbi:group II intron reverse transcriptase/maturase, partial [Vibrio cholerae]
FIQMSSWKNAQSPLASYAMPNQWFTDLGLFNIEHVRTGYVFSNYAEWKCA